MHIDFASPSNGTYNNASSSRQLANYLEHEDLERMEKVFTPKAFQSTDDNIYKSKVIKDIDTNIGQLLKQMLNLCYSCQSIERNSCNG